MKRVVVTGASGFIGRALVRRLDEERYDVVAVSRRGIDTPMVKVKNARLTSYDNLGDLTRILDGASIVIHLAGRAHQLNENPVGARDLYFQANVESTLALVRASKIAGVRRFILMSSIGVNGNRTLCAPFTEDDVPAPVELYAESKLAAEQVLASEASVSGGLEFVTIRPPLVYGPNSPGNFGRLLNAVARGMILPLGNIRNQRSFVGLDNLIDFISCCMSHCAAANQTFLITDGEDLSTTELLRRLGRTLGVPVRLIPIPAGLLQFGAFLLGKQAIVQRLCWSLQVDISKARGLLNWTPPVSVDEGLRRASKGSSPRYRI